MNTITEVCECDLGFTCEYHLDPPREWASVLGIKPAPVDAYDAYDDSYKGRFYEGWV